MRFSPNLARLGAFVGLCAVTRAAYTLQDAYDTTNFFDEFDFFDGADPTAGFVSYQDSVSANASSLAGYADGGLYLGVDYTTANPPTPGRGSVRLTSKKSYTRGLIVADIAHVPTTTRNGCGVWPAFWTFGPNWPSSGEIDVFEGINSAAANTMTLHTSSGCSFLNTDCSSSTGCGHMTNQTATYGAGLNAIGGGTYALEWTSNAIHVFYFPRTSATPDLTTNPDPTSWGTPLTTFSGSGCDIDEHFMNHNIVFNVDFCGDWAGDAWSSDATCSSLASTCEDYVAANPGDFKEAYFLINSVRVFSDAGATKRTQSKVFQA